MNNVTKMLVTLVVIGAISGGLLAKVFEWADPQIKANAQRETERAIFVVHPEGKKQEKLTGIPDELYKVMDDKGNLIGYAIPIKGNGFQGVIKMMMGVSPDLKKITGLTVLDQVETPGLGSEITKESFTDQFKKVDPTPAIVGKKGATETPNDILTITGATISSKSVVKIMNLGLEELRKLKKEGKI